MKGFSLATKEGEKLLVFVKNAEIKLYYPIMV